MTYEISVQPSGVQFKASNDQSILDSALNNNVNLEHSCNNGSCGACKSTILAGEVEANDPKGILTDEERQKGIILTCCTKPKSHCQVQANYYPELAHIQRKVVPAKVKEIELAAEDVAIINFRLPPTSKLDVLPGQYVDLIYAGVNRSYSIANAKTHTEGVELHIRRVPNGLMSEKVFSDLKPETLVRLDGPQGTFFVRDGEQPLIFLAGGTGFAPVKAMVESLIASGDTRDIHIYWGASTPEGIYSQLPAEWSNQYDHISFTPVISGQVENWKGRTGFVHLAVMGDFESLEDVNVYACGSPVMIEAARRDFCSKQLPESHFYSDAFVSSAN